jgi:glucose-1-phosphate cytidylyltransferase
MEVVILCGGKGTRSYPLTEQIPKPMMPICGTPILVHIMRLFAQQEFTDFVLAAGHRIEVIQDYFSGRFPGWSVKILDTGPESDTGERIRLCQDQVGERFFATYGDGVGNIDLRRLLSFHRARRGLATLTSVPLPSQYGTILFDGDGNVKQFREKPILHEHWINAGFFVFEKRVFDLWEGKNLEKEVLPGLVKRGVLFAYRHEGFWKSMDTSKDQQELDEIYRKGEGRGWEQGSGSFGRPGSTNRFSL